MHSIIYWPFSAADTLRYTGFTAGATSVCSSYGITFPHFREII